MAKWIQMFSELYQEILKCFIIEFSDVFAPYTDNSFMHEVKGVLCSKIFNGL